MKKKIKLTDFKVESFVTGLDSKIDTKNYAGGELTWVEPGSGACIECIVSSPDYSLECCPDASHFGCTFYQCYDTGMGSACNGTQSLYCQNQTSPGRWTCF